MGQLKLSIAHVFCAKHQHCNTQYSTGPRPSHLHLKQAFQEQVGGRGTEYSAYGRVLDWDYTFSSAYRQYNNLDVS